MRKYKWWWYLSFWGHGQVLVNAYIVYKTLCEEVKVNSMSRYDLWRLVFLSKIDPTHFGGRDHLVSAIQQQGIIKKYGSITTPNVSEWREIEKKWQDRNRKLDMEMSSTTRKNTPKKDVRTKVSRVNDDAVQPGGALARQPNCENLHWSMSVTGSGVAYQLCWWASGENIISQVQVCILCNVNLYVKHFTLFTRSGHLLKTGKLLNHWRKVLLASTGTS